MLFHQNLDKNIAHIQALLTDCGDFIGRKFPVGACQSIQVYVAYMDMLTNTDTIENTIMRTLMLWVRETPPAFPSITADIFEALKDGGIARADLKEYEDLDEAVTAMLTGDTLVLADGFEKAVVVSTKGFPNRGVSKADTEVVLQGAKDAFTETFRMNTALIRRRIRDTNLKVKQIRVGRRSKTDVALMYLRDVVRPDVLAQALERIGRIDVDGVLDSGAVEQFIEDNHLSPFPQTQTTERPDKAAAAILEGRIAVVVDNSPFVILIPCTLPVFFQSPEDYYNRFEIVSFVRLLRYAAGFFALALPGLYCCLALYHPSMIPMALTFKLAAARQTVPIPAVLEILLMELAFELLREAGIRLPAPIGGTIGIVGGIIIGQAAVTAGLVSPIVVVITAFTAICSFAVPHIALAAGYRLVKYCILLLSALLGLFGFWIGLFLTLIHLVSLTSFGIPYLFPFAAGGLNRYRDWADTFIRPPLHAMKRRPFFADPKQQIRMADPETSNERSDA